MSSLDKQLSTLGLEEHTCQALSAQVQSVIEQNEPVMAWSIVSKDVLNPEMPFEVHQVVFNHVYATWEGDSPKPVWIPSEKEVASSNAHAFYTALGLNDYSELHAWSNENAAKFWDKTTKDLGIKFSIHYEAVCASTDAENPGWFLGGKMNIVDSCFNRDTNDLAITYQREGGAIEKWTFGDLQSLSNQVANGLIDHGLKSGDSVAIDMVMTAEAVAIYLGAVMAGCAVVSIPDSLAPDEIQKRLEISDAKLVFTQDVLLRAGKELPLYDKILQANPKSVVVIPAEDSLKVALNDGHLVWAEFLSDNRAFDSVQCDPLDPINILFSSGTTGDPKAIPWNHTTPIKCASDGYFHHDIHANDVVAWPTNLGWMMGPWLIFAAFLNKASIALYYGAPIRVAPRTCSRSVASGTRLAWEAQPYMGTASTTGRAMGRAVPYRLMAR